jgi:hypothetical protein
LGGIWAGVGLEGKSRVRACPADFADFSLFFTRIFPSLYEISQAEFVYSPVFLVYFLNFIIDYERHTEKRIAGYSV